MERDDNVKVLLMLGEVGGVDEYAVCEALRNGDIKKPLVAWCIGTCASAFTFEVCILLKLQELNHSYHNNYQHRYSSVTQVPSQMQIVRQLVRRIVHYEMPVPSYLKVSIVFRRRWAVCVENWVFWRM